MDLLKNHSWIATAALLLSCSAQPDVTVEKVDVIVPRLPAITVNPVIILPAACDGGAADADQDAAQ